MAKSHPKTIREYIDMAVLQAKPHLTRIYSILKSVAPQAQEVIKWGTPFFIEPRFLFAFSAHKAHVGFTSSNEVLYPYRKDLKDYEITKMGILKIPYNKPIPEALIKKIAKARVKLVKEREDNNFW